MGELDKERTITSNFVVSPFVAFIPYQFKPNPKEVEELVEVPISALLDRANLKEELISNGGKTFLSYYYHYQDRVIWGATARILKKFLDLIFH